MRTLKEVCYGWDLCYGLPSCQDTPKTSARRWMAMARWGERQGVQAKSSNPKPYSNLTLIDNKKKTNTGGKVMIVWPISNLQNTLREKKGSWHFGGIHMKGIGPWTFWHFIDPVKNI